MHTVKNVFVFGADAFNVAQLERLNKGGQYRFHELFSREEVKAGPEFRAQRLLEEGIDRLKRFPGSVDAIVGYWDFPVSTMLPLLRRPFGLVSPSFEAVLKCEHKYWSRLEQNSVVPYCVPDFCAVNPFADEVRGQITVDYPFWIKPVKAASSHLGFKVRNEAELDRAIAEIREKIFRFANPFNYLLQFADMPGEIAGIDGNHCIVEEIISHGRQCTLEGYVYKGEVVVYGVIDSIREGKHRSCFARYQYPSTIPQRVQREMIETTRRFLNHIDFDNGPFNIEYYWESGSDHIWLLEVNARISKSHIPLFRDVDGATHQKVMLELALGKKPEFPHRQGRYNVAAKFMWRVFQDAIVAHVTSEAELESLRALLPSAEIQLHIGRGQRLSSLSDQDSYSYEIADIFLGGRNQKELLQKYRTAQEAMHIEFEPVT
jgi:biotin carboxylase